MVKRIVIGAAAVIVGCGVVLAGLVLALRTLDAPPPQDAPGYVARVVTAPHRDVPIPVGVWYPAAADVEPAWMGRNALFLGHGVRPGATARPGAAPVAVMSHGSGGSGVRMGWLAAHLARAGWIVVAPDHPGTRSRDSLPAATVRVWERTADVTAVLDALPDGAVPDGRVAAIGFSLGGHTALALGGVRLSKAGFVADCAARDDYDCGWLARGGIDLEAIDAARYDGDLSDARIQAVVAIDPALAAAMTDDSLAAVDAPVLVVNLGDPPPDAMRADAVVARMPDATHAALAGASHFAMLPACSALGRLVLGVAVRADEDICASDPVPRDETQADVAARVATFLDSRTERP